MLDSHQRRRPFRATAYTCLGLGGAVLIYDPTRSLAGQTPLIRWVWGSFLVIGAMLSIYGVIRDRWLQEWIGIPLQASAMMGLVLVMIAGGGNTGRIAFSLFLASTVVVLTGRFLDLWVLGRAMTRLAKRERRPRDE